MPTPDRTETAAIRARCTRFLSGHGQIPAKDWVDAMARSPNLALGVDQYSEGPAITHLEQTLAGLLGKPATLWFPKGIIAQQAVLLVHAANTGANGVALHPKSHLALDEQDAIHRLAGLTPIRTGTDHRHFTITDLAAITEPLAALTIELPLRRAGYQALSWPQLTEITNWAREHRVPVHIDGARLWEVQPWYDRPLADIAALADTIYVSLYKGLGGLGGCILAGPKSIIDGAKPWRTRYGGDLPTAFPMVITALDRLANTLPKMPDYHRRACELATAITAIPDLAAFPSPPHCNSFQVHFSAPAEALTQAALAIANDTKRWLFGGFSQGLLPNSASGEIVVGDATMAWTNSDIVEALMELNHRARSE